MDYIIREMRSEEYCLLSDFLYEAIYIPEGIEPPLLAPPRLVRKKPS